MTAKEQLRAMLEELPDTGSVEDALYALYVRLKIERGLDDVDNGRVISDEDARREFLK
jgi:hypothetical protein